MKLSQLAIPLCTAALSVTVLTSAPVSAQTSPSPGIGDTTTPSTITPDTTTDTTTEVRTDDGFDWGWLGLLGLLGLAGLKRKPETRVEYRDPRETAVDPTARPDYRR